MDNVKIRKNYVMMKCAYRLNSTVRIKNSLSGRRRNAECRILNCGISFGNNFKICPRSGHLHSAFCIFFVKLEFTDLLSYPDRHITKSHRHKPMAFSGDPERTRTVDLQRDRLAC